MPRKELSLLNRTPRSDAGAPAEADTAPRPKGLRIEHIARSFGARQVVRDVSLTVQRGEVVGLLGPNGAGKTTCFYMITGLIPPDSGRIWLDGEDITAQPMYQRARLGLGYLAQEASIFRGMTVGENVAAVATYAKPSPARASFTARGHSASTSNTPAAIAPPNAGMSHRRLTGLGTVIARHTRAFAPTGGASVACR